MGDLVELNNSLVILLYIAFVEEATVVFDSAVGTDAIEVAIREQTLSQWRKSNDALT